PAERAVELGIPRVDAQERRLEGQQLPEAGDDLDVLDADTPQHRGTELLVPAAEDRALTADDADQERDGLFRAQREQVALRKVAAEQPARAHGVHAEQ